MCTLYIVNVLNNEYADDKLNFISNKWGEQS
jgi:hypothetical protein